MIKIGDFELYSLSDGLFRLDGGAMFGQVPKVLWQKVIPSDDRNRIQLSLNPLLIKGQGKNILVDTGIGSKYGEKFIDIYAVDHSVTIQKSLQDIGLSCDDIDIVIPTHLHFDHMGGATTQHMGEVIATFRKATYIVQGKELEVALSDNPRSKGSYLKEDFLPLEKEGKLKIINGDEQILIGVTVKLSKAHTQGHQIVFVESKEQKAVYLGDLMPTTAHVKPAWCMGYDAFPLDVAALKMDLLKKAFNEGWIIIFDHDIRIKMARIADEYKVVPISTTGWPSL